MDREDITRMAREAGLSITTAYGEKPELARFAALVAKHEREACAKVAEEPYEFTSEESHRIAASIRARGNT
jgi:hypothetical protein